MKGGKISGDKIDEPQYVECRNCRGVKCMSCVYRDTHRTCVDDCPECCNLELFDIEEYRPAPQSTAHLY